MLKLKGRKLGCNMSPDVSSQRQQSVSNGAIWIHKKRLLSPGLRPGPPSNADTHQISRRHTIKIKASPTSDPLLGSDGRSPLVSELCLMV